jgi:hypothetical protein
MEHALVLRGKCVRANMRCNLGQTVPARAGDPTADSLHPNKRHVNRPVDSPLPSISPSKAGPRLIRECFDASKLYKRPPQTVWFSTIFLLSTTQNGPQRDAWSTSLLVLLQNGGLSLSLTGRCLRCNFSRHLLDSVPGNIDGWVLLR